MSNGALIPQRNTTTEIILTHSLNIAEVSRMIYIEEVFVLQRSLNTVIVSNLQYKIQINSIFYLISYQVVVLYLN